MPYRRLQVLRAIARYPGPGKPSWKEIAERAGTTVQSLRNILRILRGDGLVVGMNCTSRGLEVVREHEAD